MKTLDYTVRFTSPAFLGDAEQSGRWRTPPFKALLRQWWRVAYAAQRNFQVDVAAMRREEGFLFGNAWLADDFCKSLVRIRLSKWTAGTLARWSRMDSVAHPEVSRSVDSGLYLAYGPVVLPRGQHEPTLKRRAAIQAGETATLSLAFPDEYAAPIETALWLIDRYGTVGGRSRNGWGSFAMLPSPSGNDEGDGTAVAGATPYRPWRDCLSLDWPHAIGFDDKPLIWRTQPVGDWKQIMRELAIIKIGLRTQFVFPNVSPPHRNVEPRHWLSYPITTHTTRVWERGARLPNSLRFKVRLDPNDPSKLVGVIFHVPCRPPADFRPDFRPDNGAIAMTWQAVHALLDELARPVPSRAYLSITDADRRAKLKPQLGAVKLTRIPE